jgi:prolyl 4-hydroxylase
MSVQKLDKPWIDWINENIELGCDHDMIMHDMLKSGISKETALFYLNNPSVRNGDANALENSNLIYVQEPSYLFQHDNTITTQDGQQIQVAMRISAPDVVLLDNFMTHAECDELCELSKSTLTKSTVVDDVTGKNVGHEHRTSLGTFFSLGQYPVVQKVETRIAEITATPVPHGEGIQILNYASGGEYRPHFDYFLDNDGGRVHTAKAGQRIITVIMYLNDVKAGGATVIPGINLSVYPKKGSALYFSYFNSKGQVDPATLHGGSPVIDGEKWIATKWIRERVYA